MVAYRCLAIWIAQTGMGLSTLKKKRLPISCPATLINPPNLPPIYRPSFKRHPMNRKEQIRITEQENRLRELGFSGYEAEALRKISMTLHRWAERECNGEVEVDDSGKAWSVSQGYAPSWKVSRYPVPNREAGALRRLAKMMQDHPGWDYYHQTDPRGVALYLVNLDGEIGDMPIWEYLQTRSLDSVYSQVGICIW